MGLFKKDQIDVPKEIQDELERHRGMDSMLSDLTGALLFPEQFDSEASCPEASYYRLKQDFHSGAISAEGYAEFGDSFHGDFYLCQEDRRRRVIAAIVCPAGNYSPAALLGAYLRGLLDNWLTKSTMQDPLINLGTLCDQLNQATEHRSLPGRFATITVLALDSATGQLWVTSRGDSLIPIIHQDGSMAKISLGRTPALWTIPEMMLADFGTKAVRTFKLSKGDTLFLGNGPFDNIPGTDDAGPDFLLSMLRAVSARGSLKMPAKEGRQRPPLDLSALPADMALTERMSVALLALRLHDLASRRTQADTEERPSAATLYIKRTHAEILGMMFPDLETAPHTNSVSKLPIELYGGFKSPVAFTLRYNGAPG